jgi:hypothetical protein
LREKVVGLDKTLLGFATAWAEYGNVAPATSKRVLASARMIEPKFPFRRAQVLSERCGAQHEAAIKSYNWADRWEHL